MAHNPPDSNYRSLSFWHDNLPESLQPRPPLTTDIDADVAIVGAGYTGLWTAWYLKQLEPSLNIAILEAEIAGFGASGRNGGWCSGYLSGIEYWLNDQRSREGAIRLQRLMFDAVDEVGRVSQESSIDCHYERSGNLEIAVNKGQLKRLRKQLEYSRSLGFGEEDYRWLDQGQIRQTLDVDQALAAVHMSHTAAIHPCCLARGLAERLEGMGVTIFENSPVTDLGPNYLETANAKVRSNTLIVATEGYSDSIPDFYRRQIPVHSMMVATEPLSDAQLEGLHFDRRYTFGNLDHLVTYGQLTTDRRIAFGCRGTYHYGSGIREFPPDDPEFQVVRDTLLRFFPDLKGIGFTHAWGGAMGVTRSMRPSVNFDPDSGVGWAGGYFGNGVGASNLAGRTLADLVLNRDTDRVQTPWVNPRDMSGKWEIEPVRWLGFRFVRLMMKMADRREYLS